MKFMSGGKRKRTNDTDSTMLIMGKRRFDSSQPQAQQTLLTGKQELIER